MISPLPGPHTVSSCVVEEHFHSAWWASRVNRKWSCLVNHKSTHDHLTTVTCLQAWIRNYRLLHITQDFGSPVMNDRMRLVDVFVRHICAASQTIKDVHMPALNKGSFGKFKWIEKPWIDLMRQTCPTLRIVFSSHHAAPPVTTISRQWRERWRTCWRSRCEMPAFHHVSTLIHCGLRIPRYFLMVLNCSLHLKY